LPITRIFPKSLNMENGEDDPEVTGMKRGKRCSSSHLRKRKLRMISHEGWREEYLRGLLEEMEPFLKAGVPLSVRPRPLKPTCGARTRLGGRCRAFGLANGRRALHGGKSTGPATAEGWERTRAGYEAWVARRRAMSAETLERQASPPRAKRDDLKLLRELFAAGKRIEFPG
jgi:hypothetical protein